MSSLPSLSDPIEALGRLLAERRAQEMAGRARLQRYIDRLDVQDYTPSPATSTPMTSHSSPEPTMTPRSPEPDLRDLLPQRTTHGGPFGASVVERVARAAGILR